MRSRSTVSNRAGSTVSSYPDTNTTGSGYAGLNPRVSVQPDPIELDPELIRGVAVSSARRTIIACSVTRARQLGVTVLAEGIGTEPELRTLQAAGIRLFQGFLFAEPAIASLPSVRPDISWIASPCRPAARGGSAPERRCGPEP